MKYEVMPELMDYVVALKAAFPVALGHILPEKILYVSFSKKKSSDLANICPVPDRLGPYIEADYSLAVHKEAWELSSRPKKLYIIMHELYHIPIGGFDCDSNGFHRTIKHDLQDFIELRKTFGIELENINKLDVVGAETKEAVCQN